MIDIQHERTLIFPEVADRLPGRRGKPLNVATLHRWAQKGIRGIRLEYVCIGGQRATSLEAVNRFFERLTAADAIPGPVTTDRSPAQVDRAVLRAEAQLEADGV